MIGCMALYNLHGFVQLAWGTEFMVTVIVALLVFQIAHGFVPKAERILQLINVII